ncbi:hypothetical protein AGMMS49982_05440 [Bacteroidia bacterium]|nr:hypothetical protein AGMMS49982_05440 [Bacteroidia bacterium]
MAQAAKQKKRKRNYFRSILGGDILTEAVVVQQAKLLVLIVVLVIILISNNYACDKKLSRIEALKGELQDVKYENLFLMMQFTKISRQSQVKELLHEQGSELMAPTTPAFEIERKKQ